jgi:hypothetical protein
MELMKLTTEQVSESYRVVIVCKYLGPTTHKGSRIKIGRSDARKGESIVVSWQDEYNTGENYAHAVQQFLTKMAWGGTWQLGIVEDGAVAVQYGY